MHTPDTEVLFPPRGITSLFNERGVIWQNLITTVEKSGANSSEQMAFILMLARLNSCATCNANSYRAMLGCISCAKQSLKRFHGSDEELNGLYETARTELGLFLEKNNDEI